MPGISNSFDMEEEWLKKFQGSASHIRKLYSETHPGSKFGFILAKREADFEKSFYFKKLEFVQKNFPFRVFRIQSISLIDSVILSN
jgi:hypothetical protein